MDLHIHSLDIIIGHFQDDEDDNDKAPYKALFRHTYTITRGSALNVPGCGWWVDWCSESFTRKYRCAWNMS